MRQSCEDKERTHIWNLAAMKGREKPNTRKVVRLMATGTLRVGPEGKGTIMSSKIVKVWWVSNCFTSILIGNR